jgi:hypothetical protein
MKNQHFAVILEYLRHLEDTEFKGTGRTARLLNKLQPGDALVVLSEADKEYFTGLFFLQQKQDIELFVMGNADEILAVKESWDRKNPLSNFHLHHRVIAALVDTQLHIMMQRFQ